MCGRYVQAVPWSDVAEWMGATTSPDIDSLFEPRWNVAPTCTVLGVRDEGGERIASTYRWGLVPSWAKEIGRASTHNARVETVTTRPTFRDAWRKSRRLIVPADGYYEWQVVDGGTPSKPGTQPWFMSPANDDLQLTFAGLYDFYRPPGSTRGDPWLVSCTVITTKPGPDVADIHDRQPVVLPRDQWDVWLDPSTDEEEARSLLVPAPRGTLARRRVGRAVGNSRNEGAQLIEELVAIP